MSEMPVYLVELDNVIIDRDVWERFVKYWKEEDESNGREIDSNIQQAIVEYLDRRKKKKKQKEIPCLEVGEYPCKIKDKWEKIQVLYCKVRGKNGIEYLVFDGSQWWKSKKLPIYEGCKKDWKKWEEE